MLEHARGQVLSIDFFVAIGGIIISLLLVLYAWHYVYDFGTNNSLQRDLDRVSANAALSLLTQPGIPSQWYNISNASQIQALGIVQPTAALISMDRLFALNRTDLNTTTVQRLLGVSGPGYRYYLETYYNGTTIFRHGELPSSSSYAVSVQEYALYNGTHLLIVRLGVWVS